MKLISIFICLMLPLSILAKADSVPTPDCSQFRDQKDKNESRIEASKKKLPQLAHLALACGADPNHQSPGGFSALGWAINRGQMEITQMLLDDSRTKVDLRDYNGATILSWYCYFHDLSPTFGRLLLDHGADILVIDDGGYTALMYAARGASLERVKFVTS